MAAAPPASFAADGDNAPETASTHRARVYTGVHQLRISPYSAAEGIGAANAVTSDEFKVRGHRWAITYYPHGFDAGENRGYVSVFLSLASAGRAAGSGGVRAVAEFGLVDRARCAVRHSREVSHTFHRRGEEWGFPRFVRRADLAAGDDWVVVRCAVRVVEGELAGEGAVASVRVPPPDLHRDLGRVLLHDGVGADVTFVVRGRAFRAHRCVLAARSPVLRAELYGAPMREAAAGAVVEVREMEPAAFAAMLHFIYTDSLPPEAAEATAEDGASLAQHLLGAADRYALGRLSLACQDRLARHVDASTAAATYALASQHGIPELKAAVVEFLARRRGRLEAVAASDGFRRLEQVDPAVAGEIVSRAGAARRWMAVREAPASCLRFSGKVCRSYVWSLAEIWASFVRFMAMACAYMHHNFGHALGVLLEFLLFLLEHPDISDDLNMLYRGLKRLRKKVMKCITRR